MARVTKTPGETTPPETNAVDLAQLPPGGDGEAQNNSTEQISLEEQVQLLTQKLVEAEEQLLTVTSEFATFKNEPDALQDRLYEIKPELKNPNLRSDMASRPSRPVSVGGKLTDKGWIV